MKDVNVIHDKVGVYSYWNSSIFHEAIQEPWLTRYWHDYFVGKHKPNYPVPAIRNPIHPVELWLLDVLLPKPN